MLRPFLRSLVAWLLLAGPAHAASTYTIAGTTYTVDEFPISASITDTSPLPLDLAIDRQTGNTIYMVPEFDRRIYSVARTATNNTTMTTITIDGPASPLFRSAASDTGTTFSPQQERIDTTSDGSVWVSQGGNCFTSSTKNNWSRIMRRRPDATWEAYTLPVDSACAVGFFVTDTTDVGRQLWVMSAGTSFLYFSRPRWWHEGETTATRYPPVDVRWTVARDFGGVRNFPAQLIRLADGRLAGTLYFGNAFFLYDPRTLAYTRVTLPTSSFLTPTGAALESSGPWKIRQHVDGNLWIAEDYAHRVTKVALRGGEAPGTQTTFDLSASLSSDENPHSLAFDASGNAWITTYPLSASGDGRLVRITNAGTVTVGPSFATISLEGGLTGIEIDSAGAIWAACFRKRRIVRLTPQ